MSGGGIALDLLIPVAELEQLVPAEGTLEERTVATMRLARSREHELLVNGRPSEGRQFKVAVGAMLAATKDTPDREPLTRAFKLIVRTEEILEAKDRGLDIDLEAALQHLAADFPDRATLPPLRLWWAHSQNRRRGQRRQADRRAKQ